MSHGGGNFDIILPSENLSRRSCTKSSTGIASCSLQHCLGSLPGFLKEPDTAAYPDLWKAETIRDFSLQMVGKWGERNALTNHLMASLNWNCLNCARCCPFPTAFLQQIRSGNLVNSHGTRTTWSTLKWTQDCVQKLFILGVKTNAT